VPEFVDVRSPARRTHGVDEWDPWMSQQPFEVLAVGFEIPIGDRGVEAGDELCVGC
jgi:hypothetical protein